MKKKSILLLGGNYYPESTGIGKYNGEMMDWFSKHGYECIVVTCYPYYPYWKIQDPYVKKSFWYRKEKPIAPDDQAAITVYRCPHYVPAIPTGTRRILSDISFFLSAFFQVVRLLFRKKCDYVMVVAPPFQIGLLGWLYKAIKGARFMYHIQDLQIDAAAELNMIKSKSLVKWMFAIERFILKKADYVSSISEGMIARIQTKYKRPVILFPNWADVDAFHPIFSKEDIKAAYNFSTTDKIILYSGAIGEKQGLQALLLSALELNAHQYIKFIICGSGPYKEKLIEMAKNMSLDNVHFLPLQPREKFNKFLNMADVHLILQKANENELFLPSKLTTICAVAGLVIVTASEKTSLYKLINDHQLGLLIAPEDQSALTECIKKAIYQDHSILQKNARYYATEYLSIDKVLARYCEAVDPGDYESIFPRNDETTTSVAQQNNIPQRQPIQAF